MRIGNIKLKSRVFLAPMVDVTDLPFRILCVKYGAGMVYTEMIVANSLIHDSKASFEMARISDEERPVGLQLAGNDKEIILRAAGKVNSDLLDLNFGCPSHKVVGSDFGSSLLRQPRRIMEIISFLSDNLNKPVTAKVRLGYRSKNYLEVGKGIEKAGAEAICLHGRTAFQHYEVKSDWDAVRKLKKELSIPVIASGDVYDGETAKKLLKDVDFVMVARAAIGDPFVFDRINRYLGSEEIVEVPSLDEKYGCFLEYCKLAKKYDLDSISRIRRTAVAFVKNFNGAAKLRDGITKTKNLDEIKNLFEKNITS